MLTRRRALFRLLAAMVAVNAGCDFGGSNTPATEPDLTLDGRSDAATAHDAARDALADAPSETRPADGAIEAAVVTDAGATIDAAEAAAIDAGAIVDAASDVAPPPAVEAGIDATVDAGIDAGVDAASVVVVDAADADARDAAPAPVAVTISGPTGPESGVPVVFHDPSGTQLGVVTTDSTGAASMLVPPGSMVTAIFGNPNSSVLVSIAAVQPGDVIPIVDPAPAISLVASPTIHLPDSAPPSGTTQYELVVGGSCGSTVSSSTSTVTVDVESNCVGPSGLYPVLALAEAPSGSPLAFDVKLDNPIGTDGGAPDVFLSGAFSSAFGTQTIETANSDPDGMPPSFASMRQIAGGTLYAAAQPIVVQGDGSSQTILALVPGFGSAVQTEVDVEADVSVVAWASREAAPPLSGTDAFDLSTLPPEIVGSSIDASNVATPSVTWQSTNPLSNGTAGILVTTSWNGSTGDIVQSGTWLLVVPSTAASASPPALSDSVAAYTPVANAEWNANFPPGVAAFSGSLASDYNAVRPLVGSILSSFVNEGGNNHPEVPTLPSNGTLAVTVYPFNY